VQIKEQTSRKYTRAGQTLPARKEAEMQKRIAANYAVSREQKRLVAKNKAKAEGITRMCSKGRGNKHDSWFANHWREFAERR
jgi:hypothetical protein